MSAPSYTTGLTTITTCDSGTFLEFTGYTQGTLQTVPETDYFIQDSGGGGCVSTTVKTVLNSIGYNNGSGITVPTDGAVMFWQFFGAPNSLNTFANGGQRAIIGSGIGDFKAWCTGGSDYSPNPYGGWKNVAVDPTVTADFTTGSPGSTLQYFGLGVSLPTSAPGKGAPFGMDAIRYGRCEFRVANGDNTGGGFATFSGMASANDALSARWGLFQAIAGGYLWKGLMTLGYGAATWFEDSNKVVLIDDCPRVGANFSKIEIRQAGSTVNWTNITIQALGTTAKGRLEVIDNADVNFDSCSFVGMDTLSFLANSAILDSVFRGCGIITAAGSDMRGSLIRGYEGTANTSALIWNVNTDPNGKLDNMTFVKGTAATHAIEFGTTSPLTMTLVNPTFTGYNASNGQNDSAIHIKRTTGTVTITISGGTTPSYRSDGATVVITSGVTITLTGLKTNTEVRVFEAGTQTEISGTGAEDIDSGTHAFSVASGQAVDIRILNLNYQIMSLLNYSTTANATIPISQVIDRQYANP